MTTECRKSRSSRGQTVPLPGRASGCLADRVDGVAVGAESLHDRPCDALVGDEIHTDAVANGYTTSVRMASAANRIAARTSDSVMCG